MGRSRSRSRGRSYGYSYSRSRSRSPSDDGVRVHVADLGVDPSRREIEKAFEKFGRLIEVWVAKSPPCFAFIVYKYREDAEAAIREMDGKALCGGRIRVSFARPRTRGRRRRGFDPNLRCYQCGRKGHFFRDCDDMRRYKRRFRSRSSSRSFSRSPSRSRSRGRRTRVQKYRSQSRSRSASIGKSKKKSPSQSPERSPSVSRSRHRSSSPEKIEHNDKAKEASRSPESTQSGKRSASVERSPGERSPSISPQRNPAKNQGETDDE